MKKRSETEQKKKHCLHCGREYEPKNIWHKYCSRKSEWNVKPKDGQVCIGVYDEGIVIPLLYTKDKGFIDQDSVIQTAPDWWTPITLPEHEDDMKRKILMHFSAWEGDFAEED